MLDAGNDSRSSGQITNSLHLNCCGVVGAEMLTWTVDVDCRSVFET